MARSISDSNMWARTPQRKVEKRVKPEGHHMHSAVPALFTLTSEVVVHLVTRRRLVHLKDPIDGSRIHV